MKNLFLAMLLLAITFTSIAQKYEPLLIAGISVTPASTYWITGSVDAGIRVELIEGRLHGSLATTLIYVAAYKPTYGAYASLDIGGYTAVSLIGGISYAPCYAETDTEGKYTVNYRAGPLAGFRINYCRDIVLEAKWLGSTFFNVGAGFTIFGRNKFHE